MEATHQRKQRHPTTLALALAQCDSPVHDVLAQQSAVPVFDSPVHDVLAQQVKVQCDTGSGASGHVDHILPAPLVRRGHANGCSSGVGRPCAGALGADDERVEVDDLQLDAGGRTAGAWES